MRSAIDAGLTLDHLAGVMRKVHEDWDRAQSETSVMEGGCTEIAAFVSDCDPSSSDVELVPTVKMA